MNGSHLLRAPSTGRSWQVRARLDLTRLDNPRTPFAACVAERWRASSALACGCAGGGGHYKRSTMDISAWRSMKDAAKCEKCHDLQIPES
jgi:hypothetical protein